jgi:hypothetical protein
MEALTMNPRPRNLLIVLALAGDSTMTRVLGIPLGLLSRAEKIVPARILFNRPLQFQAEQGRLQAGYSQGCFFGQMVQMDRFHGVQEALNGALVSGEICRIPELFLACGGFGGD